MFLRVLMRIYISVIFTLASRGLEEPFFQLCCCAVSVFGSGGKKVLIYIHMYYLEYNTVVVVC